MLRDLAVKRQMQKPMTGGITHVEQLESFESGSHDDKAWTPTDHDVVWLRLS